MRYSTHTSHPSDRWRAKSRTRRVPYDPGQEGERCRFGSFSIPRCRGSLLFICVGGLSYYKRGRFREIGPVSPVEVLLQCAQYAHTLRGSILYIGDSGGGCAAESDIYNCANEAYAKLGTKLRIGGESHCPYFRSTDGARIDIDPPGRSQFGNWAIFDDLREISAKTPKTPLSTPHVPPGHIQRPKCLKMEGAIQYSLVCGVVFSHYLDYMSLDTEYGPAPQIFTREIIRQPGRWGNSAPLRPLREMYESIAIGGYCPIFPVLSLSDCASFYEDACVSAVRMLEIGGSKYGIDRTNHLQGLACADCAHDIAGRKLGRGGGTPFRETHAASS